MNKWLWVLYPLGVLAFVLYSVIKEQGRLTASQEKLAEQTGYHATTICMALEDLRQMGLITARRNHAKEPFTYEVKR